MRRAAGIASCVLLFLGTLMPLELGSAGVKLSSNHLRLLSFALVYGLGYGMSYCVVSSKPAQLFGGMTEFSMLQAFLMLFQVIGGFFGTVVTGMLRDATGSYVLAFG